MDAGLMTGNEVGLPSIAETEAAAGRGRRFKTKEAADAYIAHLKEPPTVVPETAALTACPTHAVCPQCREGWGHWNGHEYVPTIQSEAAKAVYVSHECYGNRHGDCAWPRCECGCHHAR